MNEIFVHGLGAVSPAGWTVTELLAAVEANAQLAPSELVTPGKTRPVRVRAVPPPKQRPAFLAHPRLRRASPCSQHLVAAALEALGEDAAAVQAGKLQLGIVACTMAGGVAYSRRFYEEAMRDPGTASPLIFPETVFNAPASHLAAYLNSSAINYSLVGDDGTFVNGLALGAEWLAQDRVEGCIIIGVEELDWVVAEAARLFNAKTILSAGAGAVYLKRGQPRVGDVQQSIVALDAISDPFLFTSQQSRTAAARRMRQQFPGASDTEALCWGQQDVADVDEPECAAWSDWTRPRLAPKRLLGEAFVASAAWQCVAACAALQAGRYSAVNVSIVGANEQAIGARFVRATN